MLVRPKVSKGNFNQKALKEDCSLKVEKKNDSDSKALAGIEEADKEDDEEIKWWTGKVEVGGSADEVEDNPMRWWKDDDNDYGGEAAAELERNGLSQQVANGDQDEPQDRVPKTVHGPKRVSKAERDAHNATHIPYRDWCPHCVKGRGRSTAHKKQTEEDKEITDNKVPRILMDYFYMTEEDRKAHRKYASSMRKQRKDMLERSDKKVSEKIGKWIGLSKTFRGAESLGTPGGNWRTYHN